MQNQIEVAKLDTFFELIKSSSVSRESDFWVVEYPLENESTDVQSVFNSLGIEIEEHYEDDNKIWFKGVEPIYIASSNQELFNKVSHDYSVPNLYYVVESKTGSDESKLNIQLNLYCEARKILALLSDHCEPRSGVSKGSDGLVFIIESDDKVTKHSFKPVTDLDFLSGLNINESSLSSAKALIDLLNIGDDPREKERKYVLKATLKDFIIDKCTTNKEIFNSFLSSIGDFYDSYKQAHELYINNFSVNKILREISEKDLNYTGKINEIASGIQTKALAMPAVMVVVGAALKVDSFSDVVLVAIGVIFTSWIVIRSLAVFNATISHLQSQVKTDFERYDTLINELDIQKRARKTQLELESLLEQSERNSEFMESCTKVILCIMLFYFFYQAFTM